MQNFRAKPDTAMRHDADARPRGVRRHHRRHTARARAADARSRRRRTWSTWPSAGLLLDAGVDDWGGVSPLTPDHVNPERPVAADRRARRALSAGGRLRAARAADRPPASTLAASPGWTRGCCRTSRRWPTRDGLARADARPQRAALAGARRRLGARRAAPTCTPRSTPRAAPTTGAATSTTSYGDWDVAARRAALGRPHRRVRRRAATSRPRCGPRSGTRPALSDAQALALMTADGAGAGGGLPRSPTTLRRDTVGDDVTYVVNRNINFTNVCYTGCRFCAFAQRRTDADAYTLSLDEVGRPRRGGLGGSARPRSACRAASTPTCPARRTSTSPAR